MIQGNTTANSLKARLLLVPVLPSLPLPLVKLEKPIGGQNRRGVTTEDQGTVGRVRAERQAVGKKQRSRPCKKFCGRVSRIPTKTLNLAQTRGSQWGHSFNG